MQKTSDTSATKKMVTETDIVSLILEDHKPLKEFIEVMKDLRKKDLLRLKLLRPH